ncbi:MAG: glutathione S-transferase family protein [Halioglobus sp.]
MNKVQLIIGNRNYSSWSLRAWLCLKKSGANFESIVLPLDTQEFEEKIGDYSPNRRVPVLWDDGQCIWDSLAICEYVNERFANNSLWPEDSYSRGLGRSMVAEMHSGLSELRSKLPMNCRASNRYVELDPLLQDDIDRILALWGDSLTIHSDKGRWLMGDFSIADAMFAPVVLRFRTYGVIVPDSIQPYCDHVLADSDVQLWLRDALQETWIVEADEAGATQADH